MRIEKLELSDTLLLINVKCSAALKKLQFLKRLSIYLSYDPAILLDIMSKGNENMSTNVVAHYP